MADPNSLPLTRASVLSAHDLIKPLHAPHRRRARRDPLGGASACKAQDQDLVQVREFPEGNHAQALSLAASTMSIPAHIVMPRISTPAKIAATQSYGARVIFSGSTALEREAVVADVIAETGATLIPPYDHPHIMLGQGTAGLELQEQVLEAQGASGKGKGGLDAIITPCGGGGLLSGTALSAQGTGIRVFGAEPSFEGADDCRRGLASGARVETVKSLTIADGLRTPVGAWP
ncbi:hypothetical protein V502_04796 [Pseudogymnoascus sp. VKM F-4520 (FW-2644)]|nr:hypothetical protein V502_04796 [Pseudogymnoascus sp. VKM F-4520 (FW-2644)]